MNTLFEERVEQLLSLAEVVERIFASAGVEYRIAGGLATNLYVEDVEPDAGRLTKDIDIVVRREDLAKIEAAAKALGYRLVHVAGVDMLMKDGETSARRAIHLDFAGEKVRREYVEPAPQIGRARRLRGLRLISLPELIRMKLTSFRAKDEAHIVDLDEAGLITPEIEAQLAPELLERLARTRARRRESESDG